MQADKGPSRRLTPLIEQVRNIIAKAREILEKPMPDTFLGRKTQEPFFKEDEE